MAPESDGGMAEEAKACLGRVGLAGQKRAASALGLLAGGRQSAGPPRMHFFPLLFILPDSLAAQMGPREDNFGE